jgi:dihydroorotate dehydrogenase electron transfer subunit
LSGWHINANETRTVRIQKVETETEHAKTFYFEDKLCSLAEPGQFIMLWIPGVDEIPLSLSSATNGLVSVTVKDVGEGTHTLFQMKQGGIIGIRGPFGTHFKITGKTVLVVGGGIGTAPLMLLTFRLLKEGVKPVVVEGAKTKNELLFVKQLLNLQRKVGLEVTFATDDGSYGFKGDATNAAGSVLSSRHVDAIYTCGNEFMTLKVYLLAKKNKIPLQASLERIMLCAIGICGSCVIGKYRVCKDGPVFDQNQLKEVENELGKLTRNFKGERIAIK